MNLGRALCAPGATRKGPVREYQAAIKINPNHPQAHNGIAGYLWSKNNPEGAIREYQAAIKADPNFSSRHCKLDGAWFMKN